MPVPSTDELAEFIDDALRSKLEANRSVHNKKSRKTRIFTTVYLIIALPITCAVTGAVAIGADDGFWTTYSMPVALVFGWIVLYAVLWRRHIYEPLPFDYRPDIALPLVHYLVPRIKHLPDGGFSPDDFALPGTSFDGVELCQTRCYFSGTSGGLQIHLGDAECTIRNADDTNFEFRGLALMSPHQLRLDTTTIVVSSREASDFQPLMDATTPVNHHLDDRFFVGSTTSEANTDWLTDSLAEQLRTIHRQIVDEPNATVPPPSFAAIFTPSKLFVMRPADDYFHRPEPDSIDGTSHLHQIGRELRAFIDLAEQLGATGESPEDSMTL